MVRNNLMVGLKGTAAFAFAGPNVAWLYNNVFYQNDNVDRALIELSANPADAGGPGLELYSLNNIFHDNGGLPIYRVRDAATGNNLTRDYNVYDTGTVGDDLALGTETHSVFIDDPLFASPSVPAFNAAQGTEQIRSILDGFAILSDSPARGVGVNVWNVAATHPTAIAAMSERVDAFGTARGARWDAGLHQFTTEPTDDGGAPGDPTSADGNVPSDAASDAGGDDDRDPTGVSGGCGCRASPRYGLIALLPLLVATRLRRRPR